MDPQRTQMLNWLFDQVSNVAQNVHGALGRGLPQSTYMECLCGELGAAGRKLQRDIPVPIIYGATQVENGVVIPLVVDGLVAVAVHSVENLMAYFDQQMQAILKVSGLPLGMVINFFVPSVRGATHRIMNPNPRV